MRGERRAAHMTEALVCIHVTGGVLSTMGMGRAGLAGAAPAAERPSQRVPGGPAAHAGRRAAPAAARARPHQGATVWSHAAL